MVTWNVLTHVKALLPWLPTCIWGKNKFYKYKLNWIIDIIPFYTVWHSDSQWLSQNREPRMPGCLCPHVQSCWLTSNCKWLQQVIKGARTRLRSVWWHWQARILSSMPVLHSFPTRQWWHGWVTCSISLSTSRQWWHGWVTCSISLSTSRQWWHGWVTCSISLSTSREKGEKQT